MFVSKLLNIAVLLEFNHSLCPTEIKAFFLTFLSSQVIALVVNFSLSSIVILLSARNPSCPKARTLPSPYFDAIPTIAPLGVVSLSPKTIGTADEFVDVRGPGYCVKVIEFTSLNKIGDVELTSKALLVPVLPEYVAVIVTPVFAVGIVTEKLERTPLIKFAVVVGDIVPLLTERVAVPANPVTVFPEESFAVIVMLKGVFAVWFDIVLKIK